MSRKWYQFSLIELMMMVAIVAIIMAIAIPNLARKRMAANESNCIDACYEIEKAQKEYFKKDWDGDGIFEYASTLKELSAKGLLQAKIAKGEGPDGVYSGYSFTVLKSLRSGSPEPGNYEQNGHLTKGFAVIATYEQRVASPRNHYLITSSGKLYYKPQKYGTEKFENDFTGMKLAEE
jgi:competence protein ComGC